MIALLAGVGLVGLAAFSLAALLRLRGAVTFVLGVGLLAFAEVVAVSHALSVGEAYERRWFLVALLIVAAALLTVTAIVRPGWPPLRRGAVVREILGDRLVALLAAFVAVEFVYLLALAIFTPPNEWDALTYHLTRALFWIQNESVGFISDTGDPRMNEFPPDAEILQGATMLLTGSVRWVGLVELGAMVASVIAVYGLGCRIGLDRRKAAFGALLFPMLPVVALQGPSALNDLVVAALVASAAFFSFGRTRGELALACVAAALLVGTKVTAALALPVLLAVALLVQRGRRRVALVVGGLAACAVGAAWYVATAAQEGSTRGTAGHDVGIDDGVGWIAARATRYLVETVELPGAPGRDALLYLVAALVIVAIGLLVRRPRVAVLGAVLTALPLATLTLERVLHKAYFRAWQLAGYDDATGYGITRDSTLASSVESWYGPVGLALTAATIVVVGWDVRRSKLPAVALVLAVSPAVFLLGTAAAHGEYNQFTGRFVMGGVALAASTWGVIRSFSAASVAIVAISATTTVLSLVNYAEKPAGVEIFESTNRPSIWTLPREWAQSVQPELAKVINRIDDHADRGETVAVSRLAGVYPFAYAGYPDIVQRITYADDLAEARRRRARWAVLRRTTKCSPGWSLDFSSPPWAVYRQVRGATCR